MPVTEYSPLDEMDRADAARLAPLVAHRENNPDEDKRTKSVDPADDDSGMFLDVRTLRQQYLDYIYSKTDEIEEQKESRRYVHSAQLTDEQYRVLKARHQPVQIWNRIGRKINQIVGVVQRMRTDPKAEGRNPQSENGAEIANQSIRYVLDASEFKSSIDPLCTFQAASEAIAGVQSVLSVGDKSDKDVSIHRVIGDEYFYDPRSYDPNFKDVRFEGIAKWIDEDTAAEMFPNKVNDIGALFQSNSDLTTNPDRDIKWIISTSRRLRLVEHWYKYKGRWCWAFYSANTMLAQGVSQFYDDKNNTVSSFDMWSAAIDQDGDRYSFVRGFKGPQDALNQGKSKTLAMANARRITAEKGAVDDVERARIEAARHDGYLEINPQKQLKVEDVNPQIPVFTALTDDARNEIDGFANTGMAAASAPGLTNISGKALEILRQPGMAELGPFVMARRAWLLGLYRKIFCTVQRHWTAERWIRVSSNQKLAQFIQLNGVDLDPSGRPVLVNALGALDVNIVLDEGPDIVSMMQELSDKLSKYPPGTFPPQVLIEMDPNLPRSDKDRLLQMMQPKVDPAQQQVKQAHDRLAIEAMAGHNAKVAADTRKAHASAEQSLATAAEKRAKAGDVLHDQHLEAAEFGRDTLLEVHKIMQPFLQPQGPQAGAVPPPAAQPQMMPQQ